MQCGKPNKKGKTKEINWFYPLWNLGVGLGEPAPNPPTTEWLKTPYKMVLKFILKKNIEKQFKTIVQQLFYKPFCRNKITSDFQEFYKPFCKAQSSLNQSSLNQWVSILEKKTTNHFVDLFVVFGKESKPFCKANPNLWPNPKIFCKPFSSVPKKKYGVFLLFFWKTKPFRKVVQDINPSVKFPTQKIKTIL